MSNWKVGDVGLCINNGLIDGSQDAKGIPSLRLNAKYHVNAIHTCNCGSISLDVGCYTNNKGTRCACGALSAPSEIHWCSAIRFVKEITDEELEEQLEEAVNSDNFELAAEIRDKLK